MILGMLLFGIPATIVASNKGFASGRWLLTFGLIGLIVVICLPTARKKGLPEDAASRRKRNADVISKVMFILNAVGLLVFGLIHLISQNAVRNY